MIDRNTQIALQERLKELICLYGIAKIAAKPDVSLDEVLYEIVKLLPSAWQYPEITAARIILDNHIYVTPNFQQGHHEQTADIIMDRKKQGVVQIVYLDEKPTLDEGPFLKEERHLLNTIATELGIIVDRKKTEEDKTKLQEQLRHADRLTTIGQLAAGIAHELNEPLGNILGFAQLAKKNTGLPAQIKQDIEKILKASLHAREIIKKLLLFSRQMPPRKIKCNLNQIIEQGLHFLESRCTKNGIELKRSLASELPEITADPAQLTQVIVNIVVNATQAMPNGGRLMIKTVAHDDHVVLIIEDTGIGMSEEIMKQLFTPFFTTKEKNHGTGLGLPVVHGIITSHGGSIKVHSEVDKGTRFEIELPVTQQLNRKNSD